MHGPTPKGRYGHAAAMVGSKFYVFGGYADGEYLNDLWAFDLNSCTYPVFTCHFIGLMCNMLVVRMRPKWELVGPADSSPRPAKRFGHVCVPYDNKIILYVLISDSGSCVRMLINYC